MTIAILNETSMTDVYKVVDTPEARAELQRAVENGTNRFDEDMVDVVEKIEIDFELITEIRG